MINLIFNAFWEKSESFLLDSRQVSLLFNTLIIGLGTALLSLCIGTGLAFLIQRSDLYCKKTIKWLCLLPLLIPPYLYALTWTKIFPFFFNGIHGVIILLTLAYFPFITIMVTSGLQSIDKKLEEAGKVAFSEIKVFVKITIPLLSAYLISAFILLFIFAVSDYTVPDLLRVNVFAVEIFIKFSAFYDHGGASLLSLPLIIITLFCVLLQKMYMKKKSYLSIQNELDKTPVYKLGHLKGILSIVIILFTGMIVVVPVLFMLIQTWGFYSFIKAVTTSYTEILNSLLLALCSATVCVLISYFIAYIIEKTDLKVRNTLDVITMIPFAIPPTVLGISLIKFWNTPVTESIYSSKIILIIACVILISPFTIRILCSQLKQINKNYEEAALVTKTTWVRRMKTIVLPLLSPGLRAAWIIAFILCMRELSATLLVIPPGEETLPLKIYTIMHYGAHKLVAALSIILLLVTIIPIIIVSYVKVRKS